VATWAAELFAWLAMPGGWRASTVGRLRLLIAHFVSHHWFHLPSAGAVSQRWGSERSEASVSTAGGWAVFAEGRSKSWVST